LHSNKEDSVVHIKSYIGWCMECQIVLSKLHSHGNVLIIVAWNVLRIMGFFILFYFLL